MGALLSQLGQFEQAESYQQRSLEVVGMLTGESSEDEGKPTIRISALRLWSTYNNVMEFWDVMDCLSQ